MMRRTQADAADTTSLKYERRVFERVDKNAAPVDHMCGGHRSTCSLLVTICEYVCLSRTYMLYVPIHWSLDQSGPCLA